MNVLNFDFGHKEFFWVTVVGAIIWLFCYFYPLKKSELYIPTKFKIKNYSLMRGVSFVLGIIAWAFLTIAIMGPRSPIGNSEDKINVKDIYVVVDLSRSMLAEDMPPNRFESAKKNVIEFSKLFEFDRIGIIVFAEKVFTLLPLTTDYKIIPKLVNNLQMGPLGDGTNIGDAIALGVARLIESEAKSKVIVLITDGVANVGTMTPLQAAEEAKKNNIKVYTIGMGGDKDARLPIGRRNLLGQAIYQSIPGGSIDVKTMTEISQMTGAKMYLAKSNKALMNVLSEIGKLEKTEVIKRQGKIIYEELYYLYLLWGVGTLLCSEFIRKFFVRELV